MTNHPFTEIATGPPGEDLTDGATWLLDLVAAVYHLRRGHRPDLTVWHAITEAIDWSVNDQHAGEALGDALGNALCRIAQPADTSTAERLQAALRRWVTTMANRYNDGHHWPHPVTRRDFPPPTIEV